MREFAERRVLAVEDEMLVSMFIEDALADLGCTVVGPLTRAEEALSAVEREAIDAALLDVNLGTAGDSYAIAAALERRGIPFAFITGYGRDGVDARYHGRPVLAKPFKLADLQRILRQLLAPG